jgi:cellulose synthase/poly-beta-1,6-N-acetylglucosamine synthase-like glycosyltransferase
VSGPGAATDMAVALFAASVVLSGWSYLVYPIVLRRLVRRRAAVGVQEGETKSSEPASVEVLVSAADEEAVIGDRVRNLLAQDAAGPLRVTVGCDGSADATAARAREAGDGRVSVLEFPARRGKASVLNDLVAASTADLLVFTDANTRFEPGAVAALRRAVAPAAVGAACGRLVLDPPDGEATPEGDFWDRETELKALEGELGLCLGANGAIYAARRAAVAPLPPDTTSMDDFLIPLGILERGGRVVFARDAVARERAGRSARAEVSRRFRIGVGAGQVLRRQGWVWRPGRHPDLALIFFSRKTARWLAPLFLLAASAIALASRELRWVGLAVLVLGALLASAARAGVPARGFAGRLYYFGVINLSLAAGVAAGLLGYSRPAWKSHR